MNPAQKREVIARALCKALGHETDKPIPGTVWYRAVKTIPINMTGDWVAADGITKGTTQRPFHYQWRQYEDVAQYVLDQLEKAENPPDNPN